MSTIRLAAAGDPAYVFESCTTMADGVVQNRDVREFASLDGEQFGAVALFMRGNRHLSLCLVNRPEGPFDFYLPEQPGLPVNPDATLYPAGLVKSVLTRLLQPDLHELNLLHSYFKSRPLFLFESPPPTPAARILAYPFSFADAIAAYGLSPPGLRYKAWRMHSQILSEWCASHGVHVVPAPPHSIDENGMLRDEFCREDPAHGNLAYAHLVLEQMRTVLALHPQGLE